jgi:RNA recognition motif-containing protein
MSANNSEKEDQPKQEEPEFRNNIKDSQEEDQKENMLEPLPEENKKLFVKNIPFNTTDEQLKKFFSNFGTIVKAETMKRDNGASIGVGFVEFLNAEEKRNVLMNKDDLVIDGRHLDVREAKPEKNIEDFSKTLYVGNVPYDTTEATLKNFFLDNCQNFKGDFKVNIQTYNGKPKGYAYIEFENEEDLSNALKVNGKELDKRILKVEMKMPRGSGSVSRGRGRGRFQGGMGRRGGFGNRRYDHGRDRDNHYRDRSRGRSRSRDRSRERERSRDRERERERRRDRGDRGDRDRDRDRYRERDRDRGNRDRSDRDRDRGDRDRDRGDRDRERGDRGDRSDRERVDRERDRGDRGDRGERDRSRERRHMHMDRNDRNQV